MHIYRPQQASVCTLTPHSPCDSSAPVGQPTTGLGTADEALSRLAAAAVKRQQYTQALHWLTRLVERHPRRARYYSNRGLVYLWLGQHSAALADCDRAIALQPDLDQAYNNRALCHTAQGHLAAAIEDYECAIDLNPFNSRARINLGIALRQMGALDQALDCFDEALMFHCLPEHIYAERGRTYHLRGDWNCALADYRRALAAASGGTTPQLHDLGQRVRRWVATLVPQANLA